MSRPASSPLVERLKRLLQERPGRDDRLAQLLAKGQQFRESAVLLPLLLAAPRPGEPADAAAELLFTVRQASLPTHSGQISFPGGKREPDDPTLFATALRESDEEIGLASSQVELCGLLDDVPTTAGFSITPVVGIVRPPLELALNPAEVAESFAAPLPSLAACYRSAGQVSWHGVSFTMHEFLFVDQAAPGADKTRRIWGATARITHQLLWLLGLLPPSPER